MRSDADRVRDILEAIERIERYTSAGRGSFDSNELVQAWVVHHLEIVGEAAGRLSSDWVREHPDVPVRGIVGMRNALAHGYFQIDHDAVWNVVERDLPPLKEQLSAGPARQDGASKEDQQRAARAFDQDMRKGLQTLKTELNYNVARFAQMLGTYGGVKTAKLLLRGDRYSEGFTTLWEKGRLDMSVEFFVLLPRYELLFDQAERDRARWRLEEYGFDVDEHLRAAGQRGPDR